MNLLKSPLRRTTATLAGAFIGLAGAVAFAAPASAHYTELTGKTDCLENGGWTVDWTLTPKRAPIDGQITKVTETPGGSDLKKIVEGAPVPTGATITDSQDFSKDTAEVTLTVEVTWFYEKADAAVAAKLPTTGGDWADHGKKNVVYTIEQTVKAPEDCQQPPTSPPPTPGQPSPILTEDCTTMTIGLHNPDNGEKIVLHLTTSKGEERTLVVKPGETKTEKFSATPGFTITVTVEGQKGSETVAYQQPDNCNTGGTAGGGENGGGGLPVTGAAAGSIAGGAAVLLIAGGTMFVLARRRKVRFTA